MENKEKHSENSPEKKNLPQGINHEFNKKMVRNLIETIKSQQKPSVLLNSVENNFSSRKQCDGSLRNRYDTQKNIIELQKNKLKEQEKIINDLKIGIITDEVRDYSNKTKIHIRELFEDCCQTKLVGKVDLQLIPFKEREKFAIKTQKVPKIIQELQQRSLERMKYREMIKEKKKLLEENKKKMQQEALERKRCLEEEEKKKQLELMRDQRKEELRKQMLRQANKEKYLINFAKAVSFDERKVLAHSFSRWKFEYKWSLEKLERSQEYYEKKLLKKSLMKLKEIVDAKQEMKNEIADEFRKITLLRKGIKSFQKVHIESYKAMQVAEDFYDFKLQINTIRNWRILMERTKILNDIKIYQAILHYENKLYFHSFFKWKSLPTIMKLEKIKEERKEKWRQKVLEILPDFNPYDI